MSEKKTIQINPTFFSVSGGKRGKKKKSKELKYKKNKDTLKAILKPNNIKTSLINRIKNHQKERQKTLKRLDKSNKQNEKNEKKFADSFDKHIDYLENIVTKSKERKKEKKRKKQMREKKQQASKQNIIINTSNLTNNQKGNENVSTNSRSQTTNLVNNKKDFLSSSPGGFGEIKGELPSLVDKNLLIKSNNSERRDFTNNGIIVSNPNQKAGNKQTNFQKKLDTNNLTPRTSTSETQVEANPSINTHIPPPKIKLDEPKIFNTDERNKTVRSFPRVSNDPPYGCLKNGIKPTYSQYQRTLKKGQIVSGNIGNINKPELNFIEPHIKQPPTIRSEKLQQLKKKFTELQPQAVEEKKYKVKKTVKIFKLGKNKHNSVGVLIKSGKTRKQIKNEKNELKNRCISDIKEYLRKHNLIKVGTTAPEDVLRKIYEDSFLSGNIYNKNPDTLLHNYLNKEDDDLDEEYT